MLYLLADSRFPMQFVSAGKLVNSGGFIHPRRKIETFVLICVLKGTLYITHGEKPHTVKKNEFILLFPDTLHYGTAPCQQPLSYYWTHFYVTDKNYHIYNKTALMRNQSLFNINANYTSSIAIENYLLPEYGQLSIEKRSHLLFSQLLDISKRENYNATWRCHYALSLLLLEAANEAYSSTHFASPKLPVQITPIIEWIRSHYQEPLTVTALAEQFDYHPVYLTRMFKEHTGYPLISYINKTRLEIAKNLLCSTTTPVCIIAETCGFPDCKHFMKLFKKMEGATPSQYRNAFYEKKVVTR